MSGTQGFGEHGAFTVSVGPDPRLGDIIHELARKSAEMTGCSADAATGIADATCAVARAANVDLDLAFRPMPSGLVIEVRAARRGTAASLHAALERGGVVDRIKALVPAAELQGTGADEVCFLTCPRTDAAS